MLGVLILCIALLVLLLGNNKLPSSENKKVYIITFILLVIVMGCRDANINFGSDLNNYYHLYQLCIESNSFSHILENSSMEKGYLYLNWCLSRVFTFPQFIIFFQSIICCGVTLHFIYKYSEDSKVSIIGFMSLGLMQFYLTGFRQSIAISICLVALGYALNNKKIAFFILVGIATSIHQTAIIFLPIIILVNIKLTKPTFTIDIILILILSLVIPHIMSIGNNLFDRAYTGSFIGNALGGAINVFLGTSTAILTVIHKKTSKFRINNYPMIHILIIGTGIYAMRYQSLVLERISLYYIPVLLILLPQALRNSFHGNNYAIMRNSTLAGMLFLIYWRLGNIDYIIFN